MAEALYRKYRPQVFEDVVGQEPIQRTLKNAIAQDKVSHAYLFCGPRGTGKTTTARLLAKALLCEKGPTPDPDGSCEDCRLIAEGAHPDVYELDAASRTGVENVREEIISRVHFAPTRGRYKVYIIDEVHMLSTAAFNALLKTLEEPPSHVVFILCTTDPQKVPETIHSRCQRFDFHRISPESMVARLGAICLAEEVEFEGEALDLVAQRADGGLRNALTSLEQIIAFENGKVTLAGAERLLGSIDSSELAEIMTYIGRRDIANCFRWTADYVETGADLANFVRDMAEHVRNLYILALVGDDAAIDVTETCRRELTSELAWFGPDRASRLLGVLGDLMAELKTTSNSRLAFEVALTRMVRPDSDLTLESLAERVEALESGYSAVAHVLPGEPIAFQVADQAPAESEQVVPSTTFSEFVRPDVAAEFPCGDPVEQAAPFQPAQEAAHSEQAYDMRVEGGRSDLQAVSHSGGAPAPVAQPQVQQPQQSQVQQPQPQPQQSQVDSKVAVLANPATLQRIWQAALSDVKKRKTAYGVLFMGTKAAYDEAAGALSIQFPAENTFAFGAAQKPDVQDALSEALVKAMGEAVPFRFEQIGANQQAAHVASQQTQSAPMPAQASRPHPEPDAASLQVQSAPMPEQEFQPSPAPPEEVPYEQVPYEDADFDLAPYEDFDVSTIAPEAPAAPAATEALAAPTAPESPVAASEDAAEIQAILQASFGDGVVLSEAD